MKKIWKLIKWHGLPKIMLKKLSLAIAKLNNSLGKFNNGNNKLEQLLEEAAVNIYKNKSEN